MLDIRDKKPTPEREQPYQVLARRARPQSFSDVVGQEHVTRTLVNALGSGRLAHAFVFSGMRGVGKTTTARILAKALNCAQGPTADPCNRCSSCLEIAEGRSLDVLEVDAASQTGIDAARELLETVKYQPASGRYRIYIIDEAHGLSKQAVDAFLKTLEEPPPHVKFILATTAPQKLTSTILSRCQRFDFRAVPSDAIVERLAAMVQSEGMEADEEALVAIAREAGGSLRDATSLLDQVLAFAPGGLDASSVGLALGLPDRTAIRAVVEAIKAHDPARALEVIADVVRQGADIGRFAHDVLERVRHLTVMAVAGQGALSDLSRAEVEELASAAEAVALEDLQRWFRILLAGYEEIARSTHPRLVLEMTIVRMATLAPLVPLDELVTRLEALESGAPQASPPPRSGRRGPPPTPLPERGRPEPSPGPGRGAAPPGGRQALDPTAPAPNARPEPAAAPTPGPAAGPAAQSRVPQDQQVRWRALVEGLQREKASRFFRLAYSSLLEIGDGVIRIAVAGPEALAALEDAETRSIIERAIEREYGQALRFQAVVPGAESGIAPVRADTRSLERRGREDPLVRASIEDLGGKFETVIPRGPRAG